jgi:hypothetical protein
VTHRRHKLAYLGLDRQRFGVVSRHATGPRHFGVFVAAVGIMRHYTTAD